jgi:hypothetical protein
MPSAPGRHLVRPLTHTGAERRIGSVLVSELRPQSDGVRGYGVARTQEEDGLVDLERVMAAGLVPLRGRLNVLVILAKMPHAVDAAHRCRRPARSITAA